MKVTIEQKDENDIDVSIDDKPIGIIKCRSGNMLCYSNGRHTTTQNLVEVIRFFNGDYGSYYYRENQRFSSIRPFLAVLDHIYLPNLSKNKFGSYF